MSSGDELGAAAPTLEEKVAKPKRVYDDNKARATLEHLYRRYGRVTEIESFKFAPTIVICRLLDDSGRHEHWWKVGKDEGKSTLYEKRSLCDATGKVLESYE